MKVEVYAAGTHDHSDPKGASELIELLLTKAGYTKDLTWRCRIDKMLHCSAVTAPVRVIGFKDYGVVLRVKPGAHDTKDHQVTLQIPDDTGYNAENLFNQLKGCQKSISRFWRNDMKQKKVAAVAPAQPVHSIPVVRPTTPTPEVATPAPIPAPVAAPAPVPALAVAPTRELAPDFTTLQGIPNKPEKLRFVLRKIAGITDRCLTKGDFVTQLQRECHWEAHPKRAVSRTLGELVKFEYIQEVWMGVAICGYELTAAGLTIIGEKKPQEFVPAPAPITDYGSILRRFTSKAQELADVGRRLDAIEDKRTELRAELTKLDDEYNRLSNLIQDQQYPQAILTLMGIKESPVRS